MNLENLPTMNIKRGYDPKKFVEVVYEFVKANREGPRLEVSADFVNKVLEVFLGKGGVKNARDTRYREDELYRIWESYIRKAVRLIQSAQEQEKKEILADAVKQLMIEDSEGLLHEDGIRSGDIVPDVETEEEKEESKNKEEKFI